MQPVAFTADPQASRIAPLAGAAAEPWQSAPWAAPNPEIRLRLGSVGGALAAGVVSAALGLLQIALGGDAPSCAMFAGAQFFGLLAAITPGVDTAIGVLNLLLVGRYFFGAYVLKNFVEGKPITSGMLEPQDTAAVMLLGFAGVWLATVCVRRFVRPIGIFRITNTTEGLRAMAVLLFLAGTVSLVAVRVASSSGESTATVGGAWGVIKELLTFRTCALPMLMLYLWRVNSRRWLSHPLVLGLLFFLFIQGVLGASKQGMAEPFALYLMMALARYGLRHPLIWAGVPAAALLFQFFIAPIGQFARNEGGRDKDPREAAMATAEIIKGYLTDSAYRDRVLHTEEIMVDPDPARHAYVSRQFLAYNRIAMIGEADRLVSATDRFGYTGFESIEQSLLLMIPHFLYPNKPQTAAANFLARFAGELPEEDFSTQVSYGFMANALNAYGMAAVLPLSFLSALLLLSFASLSVSATGPFYADPWSLLAISALHQQYVEASFTGAIGAVHEPIDAFIVFLLTVATMWLLRTKGLASRADGQRASLTP